MEQEKQTKRSNRTAGQQYVAMAMYCFQQMKCIKCTIEYYLYIIIMAINEALRFCFP